MNKKLYNGLSNEEKARASIIHAFELSPQELLQRYKVARIIGFGSNGVVLGATERNSNNRQVAIKIIYKHEICAFQQPISEIEVMKDLGEVTSSATTHLLTIIDEWQDWYHFYLVTELFGSDWLACIPESQVEQLPPLELSESVILPFSMGSSDLWAWSHANRFYYNNLTETDDHAVRLLPLNPVKQILRQLALALFEMHSRGYYHGDVKAENVLVQATNGGGVLQVRLADFGHADRHSTGCTGKNIRRCYGTAQVAAPEFLRDAPFNQNDLDMRAADVFAFGMIAYSLLSETGDFPSVSKQARKGEVGYRELMAFQDGFYPLEYIPDLGDAAWELLYGLTRVNPLERVTIEQVMGHPFLSNLSVVV